MMYDKNLMITEKIDFILRTYSYKIIFFSLVEI